MKDKMKGEMSRRGESRVGVFWGVAVGSDRNGQISSEFCSTAKDAITSMVLTIVCMDSLYEHSEQWVWNFQLAKVKIGLEVFAHC